MNKTYHTVWNEFTGTWVAVSEVTNTRGKKTSSGLVATGLLTMCLSISPAVFAEQGVSGGSATGVNATAISACTSSAQAVASGERALAIGCWSKSLGNDGVAIGYSTNIAASSTEAVAIGYGATVTGDQSLALGANTLASGDSSIAIGGDDLNRVAGTNNNTTAAIVYKQLTGDNLIRSYDGLVGPNSQYYSTQTGAGSVAIGVQADALGTLATAFGTRTRASATASTALGVGATADKNGSVALGAGSSTDSNATKVTSATVGGVTFSGFAGNKGFTGVASNDAGLQISVGNIDNERQIKNVAPGEISSTSTDAINGSQLYAIAVAAVSKPTVTQGDNIVVTTTTNSDGSKNYQVATSLTPTFTSVSVTNGPTINSSGINMGGDKITNVAAGTVSSSSTDAVNGSQLYTVQQLASKGHNVTTAATGTGTVSGTSTTNIAPGDTVTYTAGNNIAVTQNGKEIQIATSLTPTFTSVSVTNGPTINSNGIDMGGDKITNVAAGTAATDAVNVSQLNSVTAGLKTEVAAGTNIASVGKSTGSSGQTIYTVNAKGTTASAGSSAVTVVAGTPDANNITNYKVDLSQTTKDSLAAADTALQTVVTQIDGTTVKTINKTNNTANFLTGDNIKLTAVAGGIEVATADDVSFTNVNTTNLTVTGETKLGDSFVVNKDGDVFYNTTITDATDGKSIVNKEYIDNSITTLANKPLTFAGDTGTDVTRKLGETVNVVGGNTGTLTDGNIGVVADGTDTLTVKLASDLAGLNSVSIVGGPTINTNGIDMNGDKITEVGAGTVSSSSTDAVNGSQLYTVQTLASKGHNVTTAATGTGTVSGTSTTNVAPGDTVTYTAGNNIAVTQNGKEIQIATSLTPTFTSVSVTNGPTINSSGIDMGGDKITNVAAGTAATDAVNVSQLNSVTAGLKTEVAAGTNIASVGKSTGSSGQTTYTVNAKGTTASAGSSAVTVVAGTPDANNITNYKVDLSQTTKDSLTAADTALQTVVTQIDGKDVKTLTKADNTANFVTGKNITLSDDGSGGIQVATADNVTFNTVNTTNLYATGETKLGDNFTVNNAGDVTYTGPITNGDNIVNKTYVDNSITTLANKPLTFAGDTGTDVTRKLGETVNVVGGNTGTLTDGNIGVVANGTDTLTVKLASDLAGLNSVSIVGGPTINSNGIDMGGDKITNVAAGTAATDAVNVSQLNAVTAGLKNTDVTAGTNIANVVKTTDASGNTFTVNANGTTASAGSSAVTVVAGTPDANNVTDYKVDLSQATKDSLTAADTALQTVVTQIDGKDVKTINKTDNTANFVTGKNITLSDDGSGGIQVATADNVTFNTVNTTNLYATGETKLGDNFTVNNAGDVTYTGPITNGDNITNKTYVDNSITTLANKPLTFAGDTGTDVTRKLGETVNMVGGNTGTLTDGNIGVVADGTDTLTVKLASDLAGLNSVSIVGGPTINNNGIDMGGDKITNLAPGTDGTDAVNLNQLTEVSNVANKGWTVATDSGTAAASNVKPSDTATFNGDGKNIAVTNDGNTVTVALTKDISVDTITLNGKDGKDGISLQGAVGAPGVNGTDGITRIIYTDPTTGEPTEVATLNDGLKFAGNTGDTIAKKLNETLTISGELAAAADSTGANLRVDSADGKLNLVMAQDLTDLNSITINGGPVINNAGINMNGGTITNLAAGVADTDAVNVSQLKEVSNVANAGWNIATDSGTASNVKPGDTVNMKGDGNVVVSNTGNDVTVGLADVVTVGKGDTAVTIDGKNGSVTVGDTTINSDGLTIVGGPSVTKDGIDAGGKQITNVASGLGGQNLADITGDALNNAVNVGDLQTVVQDINTDIGAAKTEVEAGKNVTVTSNKGADGQTVYTVATKDEVDFNKVTVGGLTIDKNNVDANGDTIIKGVGKGDVSATSTDAVNGSQLYATNQQVTQNTTDITNINTTLDKGLNFSADSGTAVNRKLGDTVAITGDGNITTTTTADGVQVKLSDSINVNNVTVNQNFSVAEGATVNMGGNVIQNVAPGVNGTDAVNVNQLNNVASNINNRITNVGHIANSGVAQAIATAGLPQAYLPGKSMMAISGGTYEGEAGYAIGFSTISDNGKWIIKATGSGNSRGKYGASIGAGYQW